MALAGLQEGYAVQKVHARIQRLLSLWSQIDQTDCKNI